MNVVEGNRLQQMLTGAITFPILLSVASIKQWLPSRVCRASQCSRTASIHRQWAPRGNASVNYAWHRLVLAPKQNNIVRSSKTKKKRWGRQKYKTELVHEMQVFLFLLLLWDSNDGGWSYWWSDIAPTGPEVKLAWSWRRGESFSPPLVNALSLSQDGKGETTPALPRFHANDRSPPLGDSGRNWNRAQFDAHIYTIYIKTFCFPTNPFTSHRTPSHLQRKTSR